VGGPVPSQALAEAPRICGVTEPTTGQDTENNLIIPFGLTPYSATFLFISPEWVEKLGNPIVP
jgi:hypothetical protein